MRNLTGGIEGENSALVILSAWVTLTNVYEIKKKPTRQSIKTNRNKNLLAGGAAAK